MNELQISLPVSVTPLSRTCSWICIRFLTFGASSKHHCVPSTPPITECLPLTYHKPWFVQPKYTRTVNAARCCSALLTYLRYLHMQAPKDVLTVNVLRHSNRSTPVCGLLLATRLTGGVWGTQRWVTVVKMNRNISSWKSSCTPPVLSRSECETAWPMRTYFLAVQSVRPKRVFEKKCHYIKWIRAVGDALPPFLHSVRNDHNFYPCHFSWCFYVALHCSVSFQSLRLLPLLFCAGSLLCRSLTLSTRFADGCMSACLLWSGSARGSRTTEGMSF